MWNTDTPWFDVTVVMTIFAIGNIFFGHFEEHKPKGLRALKVIFFVGLVAGLSSFGLRWVSFAIIGALALVALYVHGWWLPSHGVNGLTGNLAINTKAHQVKPKDGEPARRTAA